MSTFSENLKIERQNKNLSQEELGQLIGVTGVSIMRYEKGLREPKLATIKKIANALEIPLNSLIDIHAPNNSFDDIYADEDDSDILSSNQKATSFIESVNEYQTMKARVSQLKEEILLICFRELDDDDRDILINYAENLVSQPKYADADGTTVNSIKESLTSKATE